jgi:tyrosine-protein phosphatase SIW14
MRSPQILLTLLLSIILSQAAIAFPTSNGLPNFSQVNENLYRGGKPSDAGLAYLKSIGVKTIIDLQGGDLHSIYKPVVFFSEPGEKSSELQHEEETTMALEMNYRNYPLDALAPVSKDEDAEVAQILKDIVDPTLQPVYVHCEHGKDRTGLIVAIERVDVEGWSKATARQEWIRDGHSLISRIFTGWLDRYFESREADGSEITSIAPSPTLLNN